MKKLMIALAAVAMAAGVQAAMVDWKCSATKTDVGDSVYVILGATAQDTWESVAQIQSKAISSGTIAQSGSGSRATYFALEEGVTGVSVSDSLYTVIVSADGTKYGVATPVSAAAKVYDPDAQEGSKGYLALGFATPTKEFAAVPEPTSGLLLLLGVAGLALRRRRA